MTSFFIILAIEVAYLAALVMFCGWARRKVKPWVYSLGWAVWSTVWALYDVFVDHDQAGVAINALVASFWWREFWKQKPPRSRDKVAKLIGAKAKAIREKLVAAMPKASPINVPVGA